MATLKGSLIVKISDSILVHLTEKALFCQSKAILSLGGVSQPIAGAMRPLSLYAKDIPICFRILTFIAFRVSKVIPSVLLMRASDRPSMAFD